MDVLNKGWVHICGYQEGDQVNLKLLPYEVYLKPWERMRSPILWQKSKQNDKAQDLTLEQPILHGHKRKRSPVKKL